LYANQTERRFEARTYLSLDSTSNQVSGFYSLVVTELHQLESAAGKVRRLPAVLIANLAVDIRYQGPGVGGFLVIDAVAKALSASELVGMSVIVVDPINSSLAGFYEKFAFKPLGDGSGRMALKANKAKNLVVDL
jgi:predicted N-acetyltransferase YhbS